MDELSYELLHIDIYSIIELLVLLQDSYNNKQVSNIDLNMILAMPISSLIELDILLEKYVD